MENEKRLSIKDFNEKVAIFEGNKQNSAKKDFYEKIAMFEGSNRSSKKLKEKKIKIKDNLMIQKINYITSILINLY